MARKIYSVHESIGFFLSLNLRRIRPVMDRWLQLHGVSYGSWFFLRLLWEEEGLTQMELATRLSFSAPTTQAALRKLEAEGLIELRDDPVDGRVLRTHLTARGRALRAELLPGVEEINRSLLRGLNKTETAELLRMLQVVGHNAATLRGKSLDLDER